MTNQGSSFPVSRRTVLRTGLVAGGIGVAGCLGDDDETITYAGRGGVTQEAMEEVASSWEEETGTTIEHLSYAGDVELTDAVEQNPGSIDLYNPSPNGFAMARDRDLLADLDFEEIPNYEENMADPWQDVPFLEGQEDGVYRYISTQGLAYNTENVEPFSSWAEIEREEYADQVSLHATAVARYANAAAAAGEDLDDMVEDDEIVDSVFDAITQKIADQNENVFTYWESGDEHMRLLREERAMISSAWGGRVRSLQQDGVPVEYFIPDEGAVTWSEGYAIPEASENKETVHDLLNWLYERDNLIELSDRIGYPAPIEDPPEEITELPDYTEHPDDLVWIDWEEIVPHISELESAFADVRTS